MYTYIATSMLSVFDECIFVVFFRNKQFQIFKFLGSDGVREGLTFVTPRPPPALKTSSQTSLCARAALLTVFWTGCGTVLPRDTCCKSKFSSLIYIVHTSSSLYIGIRKNFLDT